MLIGIPRETRPGETRVAATPETVKKLAASGKHDIVVESGAGTSSSIPDDLFVAAGAGSWTGREAVRARHLVQVPGSPGRERGLLDGGLPGVRLSTTSV